MYLRLDEEAVELVLVELDVHVLVAVRPQAVLAHLGGVQRLPVKLLLANL